MRNRELIAGTILTYGQQIIAVLLGLFYTPFLLNSLGQSEYGLYSTVSSAITMISLLSLGLGHGYIRYYSKYRKEDDQVGINRLNGLFLTVFLVIGAIALIVGLIVSNNLRWIFKSGLTFDEYAIANKLAFILTANVAISFPATVFNAIIIAHERFIVPKTVSMIRTVLAPAVTIPLLLLGYKSVAMVLVSFCVSIIADIILCLYVFLKMNEKFVFSSFEKGLLKGLILYTLPIALNMLIDQVNLNIDKILLGRYKGTTEVAVYNIGYTLFSMYMSISVAISSVFTPRIHGIVNRFDKNSSELKNALTSLFIKVGRIQAQILLLVLSGLIFFGKSFITQYWAGSGYNNSYYVLLLLSIPCTIPLIQNLGIEIQRAENIHQFRSIVYGVMAGLNLILSIFLCQRYGAVGSAIGTAISFFVCNGVIMNIFYHKKCSIDIISFWKSISRILLSIIPPAVVWLLIKGFFDLSSLKWFIIGVLVYIILYCESVWFLGTNSEEKQLVKRIFSTFKNKLIKSEV